MIKTLRDIIAGQVRGYQMLADLHRKTDEIYWSTVFNSAISDSVWFKIKSLNPGRWAASYPLLYIQYRIYNEIKPKSIIEFGLGETSKLSYQYHQYNPETSLIIVEQDPSWLDFFSRSIFNVKPDTLLLNIETKSVNGFETKVYQDLIPNIKDKKFDFILVDGPWGSDHFSRYQVVDLVSNNLLADEFIIIMDDYHRTGEKETAEAVRQLLKSRNIDFAEGLYSGVKDTLLICSRNFQFLTSL